MTAKAARGVAALATIAVIGVLTPITSSAAPFAGWVDLASGSFGVKGSDGQPYVFTVDATATSPVSGAASGSVTISYHRCFQACSATHSFTTHFAANQFSVNSDATSIRVATRVGNMPLVLQWTVSRSTGFVSAGIGTDGVLNPAAGGGGTLAATIFAANCNGSGSVERYFDADPNGAPLPADAGKPPATAPAAFRVRDRHHRPTCIAIPNDSAPSPGRSTNLW